MKTFLLMIFSTLAVLITGCSSGWTPLYGMSFGKNISEHQAESLSDRRICSLAGRDEMALYEAKKRDLIPKSEWSLIDRERIRIGMSECGMQASWGENPDINKSVGSYGVKKQYVFRNGNYVYVRNGTVTSFQQRE